MRERCAGPRAHAGSDAAEEARRTACSLGLVPNPGGLGLARRAVSLVGLRAGARVADVGCGSGATADWLRDVEGIRAVGLDCSRESLLNARTGALAAGWCQGDASSLPFRGEALEGVFCECVLSALRDPMTALREFSRVLAPGGRLALTDLYLRPPGGNETGPNEPCFGSVAGRNETEVRVRDAGFSILRWEDHSRCLRELAVHLIFSGSALGSRDARALLPPRLGYFLMIAEKPRI